jgi:formylglycine-generating enzyme required for sulfatase activity/uncharacterized caspase-like protein
MRKLFLCLTVRCALLISLSLLTMPLALAENRVALVIGNDIYPNLPADRQLAKAVNDARTVGDALERLGYTVIRGENLDRRGMVDRLFEFTQKLNPGDMAVVFYAGHGVSISGGNYLLPADIPMPKAGEEPRVRNMAIGEADVVAEIQERKARVAVLMIDACRDNPFRQPGLTRSIGGSRGLTRAQEAEGVFAIYSAGFGQSALDRLGNDDASPNSVFTRVLAPALTQPGKHLGDLVIDVREQVAKLAASIGHEQYPAYYDQTRGGRVFLAARTIGVEAQAAPSAPVTAEPAPAPTPQAPVAALPHAPAPNPATVPAKPSAPAVPSTSERFQAELTKMAALFASLKADQLARHELTIPACKDCLPIVVRCQTKPLRTAGDLKGHKIATLNRSLLDELFRLLQAVPVFLPEKEIESSLRSGVIDCVAAGGTKLASVGPEADSPIAPRPDTLSNSGETKVAVGVFPERNRITPATARSLKIGDEFKECDACPKMTVVPSGSFMMGSPRNEADRDTDEGPQHRVTISRPFAVGKFEVTRAEFETFARATGHTGSICRTFEGDSYIERPGRDFRNPGFQVSGNHPAVCINWHDAKSYVAWLSKITGKQYRLLSEAEWEYAARAGTATPFATGKNISKDQANFKNTPAPGVGPGATGRFAANNFGLHDMHGNVWEWVDDCWNGSYRGAPTNGSAWLTGTCAKRGTRGGGWYEDVPSVRSANRYGDDASERKYENGFRIARTISDSEMNR